MFADKREAIFVGVIDMIKGESYAKILISLSEKGYIEDLIMIYNSDNLPGLTIKKANVTY